MWKCKGLFGLLCKRLIYEVLYLFTVETYLFTFTGAVVYIFAANVSGDGMTCTHASTLHGCAAWQLGPMQPVNIAPSANRTRDYDLQITQGHATCRFISSSSTTITHGQPAPLVNHDQMSREQIPFSDLSGFQQNSATSISMRSASTSAVVQTVRVLHRDGLGSLEPVAVATLHGCSGARVLFGWATPRTKEK